MTTNIYPTCTRAIDPYSSYNSNVVNVLNRMVTRGNNCNHSGINGLDITLDSTSPLTTVILGTGICYIDDVMQQITDELVIDMSDEAFYINGGGYWNEAGYYYITLYYAYIKQFPAPQAKIQILKPSQIHLKTDNHFFLKCVKVIFNGISFEIDSLYNYDPDNTDIFREYSKIYSGIEYTLPTFDRIRDESRIIYVIDEDTLYYGTSGRWESFGSVKDNMDTSSCSIGQLAYIHSSGEVRPAIATSISTFADCAVVQVGAGTNGDGKVRLLGIVEDVPIESGISVSIGEKLYLSASEAGKVTTFISTPYSQLVGVCKNIDSTSSVVCDIWFNPTGSSGSGEIESLYDRYQDLLLSSIFKRLTTDFFNNTTYIDLILTTATVSSTEFEIQGSNGEVFVSTSLTDPGFDGTNIVSCQISAETEDGSNILWFASNDGGTSWEQTDLDEVHTFATQMVPTTPIVGSLDYGEWVTGSINGKRAIVKSVGLLSTGISDITGTQDWVVGEILTGDDSGNSVSITGVPTSRDDCYDLKVMAYFTGNDTIQDYGIIYDVDLALDETSRNNELNIDTLYADLYEVPRQDNDGLRIYPFSDSTAIILLNIVNRYDNITRAIVSLDNAIGKTGVGYFVEGDTTPSVIDNYKTWVFDSTSIITITNLDDGYDGQKIDIINLGGNLTISCNSYIALAGGIDFVMNYNDSLTLTFIINRWIENARSIN